MANKKQQRFVEIEILKGAKLLLFLLSELRCLLIDDLIKVGIKMVGVIRRQSKTCQTTILTTNFKGEISF